MANLKLIKVTGSPFCDTLYGCIGIQVDDNNFNVIKGGGLNTQSSYSGCGWQYATAEEIAENWKLIYPHWTPEPGDNVIVTQDYGSWANQRGTIVEASSSKDYYRVKRLPDDRVESFDYTCQMILAPYNEIKVESKETTMTKFKEGDRVKCIQEGITGYGKVGTVLIVGDTSVGVKFDENVNGHFLDGMCSDGYGWWIRFCDLELVFDSKPKEETVTVRFLTEQEFKDKGLWRETRPKGWNSSGKMNKYLGQSAVIPKSSIGADGSFRYEHWTFQETDYLITTGLSSEPKSKSSFELGDYVKALEGPFVAQVGVIRELKGGRFGVEFPEKSRSGGHHLNGKCKDGYGWYYGSTEIVLASSSVNSEPERKFREGDKVTYKSISECGGKYHFGGDEQQGIVGTVKSEGSFLKEKGCYTIYVTTKSGTTYTMLESEFKEYEGGTHAVSQDPIPIRRFYVGKPVTYKSIDDCGGDYRFGGVNRGGRVGKIEAYLEYDFDYNCYKITVSSGTPSDCSYSMLESEFEEFDPSYSGTIHVPECSTAAVLTIPTGSTTFGTGSTSSDPLDVYKQTPITIKKKPKTKLTITTI